MSAILNRREFIWSSGAGIVGGFVPSVSRGADLPAKGVVIGQVQGTEVGNAVLASGGNAVDAIVAAALAAGVVAVPSTGIGGYGGHLVVAKPDGKVSAIDFNTTAAAAMKANTFKADANGKVAGDVNSFGWLATGVPGVLAGLQMALDQFGTRKFADVVKPAIRFAKGGFPVSKGLATAIKASRVRLAKDAGCAKLFFEKDEPLTEGAIFKNPDLGEMLQTLATRGGVGDFYKGDIAKQVAAAFKKNDGLVTEEDLAAYKPVEVKPLSIEWNGFVIHTPPPSSGGLTVLQTLASLKALDFVKRDWKDPETVQAFVEALRIAWHDRLTLIGDPKHADVPIDRLLSEKYAKESAARVHVALKAKKPVNSTATPKPTDGTIHLNAVDSNGMMVSLTFTHGNSFGAQVAVDGLGLILGHGMSRFDPRQGHPNSPGPGKRPMHNMCPTIVTCDNKPVLTLGATGGRKIVNTVLQVLSYRCGASLSLPETIKSPRLHTEGDLALTMEAAWPAKTRDFLKEVGYTLKDGPGATLSAIERDSATKELRSAMR